MGSWSLTMHTSGEKLCLKWNDFQENVTSAFGERRQDREFADVTLACEDGQQVEAHKVILASSSPFFLNLLRRNKHPHPLIYMRGLKSEDLVAIIDFLYLGEANVYQENLDSFLVVAEELQLKGLMGSDAEKDTEENYSQTKPKIKTPKHYVQKRKLSKQEDQNHDIIEDSVETKPHPEGTVVVTDYTVAADMQDLDEKVNSMMEVSENIVGGSQGNKKKKICKVCGKEGDQTTIQIHIEAHHITGVSHTCNICGNMFRSKNSRRVHIANQHNKST